jgi:hypothetical protein
MMFLRQRASVARRFGCITVTRLARTFPSHAQIQFTCSRLRERRVQHERAGVRLCVSSYGGSMMPNPSWYLTRRERRGGNRGIPC